MKNLFDLSFTKFIAPSIAKIVYVLIMVLVAISYLVMTIVGFQYNAAAGVLILVIFGPLVAVIYLVLARVGLESLIANIRTAENTAELVRLSGGGAPGRGPYGSAYGNVPSPPTQGPYS